jgi:D-alanine transaminase
VVEKAPQDTNQMVYIQITRGVAMRDHVMPPGLTPTVFVTTNRMYIYPDEERRNGVACVTADDFRWKKAHVKSISLAGAVLARQISADVGANETVMFRDGFLSEAAASNVWVVKGGKLIGTPKDNLVLEGIRYGLFESLCRQAGIPFELRRITREEVFAADELLVSSATKEVLPVVKLDDKTIGNGRPGPIYQLLYAGYQRAKQG